MSEKIIFLEIFQPFAQYRNPFTFYYAQTFPLPPKSTIIGMLQNAVEDWYGVKYGVENWWNLKISVHGGFESVFWNYQQLIKGELAFTEEGVWVNKHHDNISTKTSNWLPLYGNLKSQRSPIHQQELFNGHLFIFIKGPKDFIEKIKSSLGNLKKVLYLGRSEDVVFIKNVIEDTEFVLKEQNIDIEGDIKLRYPTYIKNYIKKKGKEKKFPIKQQKYPVYYIPAKVEFKNNRKNVSHKAEITKNTERVVEFEPVIYTGFDYSIILEKQIGIEIFEINKDLKFIIIKEYGWL